MVAFLYRPLVIGLPVALIACMNAAPTVAERDTAVPLGIDFGGSGPVAATARPQTPARVAQAGEEHASHLQHSGEMQMAHEGHNDAHGTGTVNSVDPTQHKVNVSHNPIPDIGWPAMTMDFSVAASVDPKRSSLARA
jgi:hypothetical protein